MSDLNSYFALAENEYLYLESDLNRSDEIGNYNRVACVCSQITEMYFKAIIDNCFGETENLSLLHSDNLRALFNKIITTYNLSISSKDCNWLGDFYFDAGNPGDDFIIVNREDALECIGLIVKIRKDTIRILHDLEERR